MDEKEQMLELYKEFLRGKERFVDRTFATNKFYVTMVAACLIALGAFKEFVHPSGSLFALGISIAGFAFAILLWANQDAYAYLLKIKFANVIDKMEEAFCFKPYVEEKNALIENAKKKKNYIFTNFQKGFALVALAIFIASFICDFIPIAVVCLTK